MSDSSGKGRSRCWSMTLLCVVNLSLALHMKTFIIYLMHTRKFAALNSEPKPSNTYISFSSFVALAITYFFALCACAPKDINMQECMDLAEKGRMVKKREN